MQNINTKFDEIGFSETWLTNENSNAMYISSDYQHMKNYTNNKWGGGLSLFLLNTIECKKLPNLSSLNENVETMCVKLLPENFGNGKAEIVGVVFHPPYHLNAILGYPSLHSNKCYMMGDFNINLLNSGSRGITSDFFGYHVFKVLHAIDQSPNKDY